jgi:hypothetical protein
LDTYSGEYKAWFGAMLFWGCLFDDDQGVVGGQKWTFGIFDIAEMADDRWHLDVNTPEPMRGENKPGDEIIATNKVIFEDGFTHWHEADIMNKRTGDHSGTSFTHMGDNWWVPEIFYRAAYNGEVTNKTCNYLPVNGGITYKNIVLTQL